MFKHKLGFDTEQAFTACYSKRLSGHHCSKTRKCPQHLADVAPTSKDSSLHDANTRYIKGEQSVEHSELPESPFDMIKR